MRPDEPHYDILRHLFHCLVQELAAFLRQGKLFPGKGGIPACIGLNRGKRGADFRPRVSSVRENGCRFVWSRPRFLPGRLKLTERIPETLLGKTRLKGARMLKQGKGTKESQVMLFSFCTAKRYLIPGKGDTGDSSHFRKPPNRRELFSY